MIFSFSKYLFYFWSGGKCSDSIVSLKKTHNEPFFLLVRKQEDAQCKWKWHMLKHFIMKWIFGATFSHFHPPFLFWENKQAQLTKKTCSEWKCRDLILYSLTFIWRKRDLKGYVCAGKQKRMKERSQTLSRSDVPYLTSALLHVSPILNRPCPYYKALGGIFYQ